MEINADYIRSLARGFYKDEETERRKLDVKRKWYDLSGSNKVDIEEFCKDLAAMANTPGPDGYIIIGVDEKAGDLFDSPIKESGLRDETLIRDLVIKRIRPAPQFDLIPIRLEDEDKTITIIKVPPSLEKPHVIGFYNTYYKDGNLKNTIQNYVPIRHGTKIFPANHYDYEYMYYDKKNIIPDYRIEFLQLEPSWAINIKNDRGDSWLTITLQFLIQNTGRNPIAISSAYLLLHSISPPISHPKQSFRWTGKVWVLREPNVTNPLNYALPYNPIVIPYNNISHVKMEFWSDDLRLSQADNSLFRHWHGEL